MFKSLARFGAAFITAITLSAPAAASTYSIDYSDLWGGGQPTPTENGWGLNLIQQGDVMFATMFVYGSDNTARWFSSTLSPTGGSTTWSGTMDQTTGSFFGAAWNNSSVTHSAVGTMTVSFSSAALGSLTYSVNGTSVSKQISRFTFRAPNLGGNYLGGATATCTNGQQILIFDTLTVSQSGSAVAMQVDFFNASGQASRCTYNGTINTTGRTATIGGTYNCTIGGNAANNGTFTVSNLDSALTGFNGNLNATDQFCTMTGYFGGVKDVR